MRKQQNNWQNNLANKMVKQPMFIKKEETGDLVAIVKDLIARYPHIEGEKFLPLFGRWNKDRVRNILMGEGKIAPTKEFLEIQTRVEKIGKELGLDKPAKNNVIQFPTRRAS